MSVANKYRNGMRRGCVARQVAPAATTKPTVFYSTRLQTPDEERQFQSALNAFLKEVVRQSIEREGRL